MNADELSPGIRDVVVSMNAAGIATCDSGDGSNFAAGMGGAIDGRHVAVACRPSEMVETANRIRDWTIAYGLDWPSYRIEAGWCVGESSATVILSETTEAKLDEIESLVGVRPRGLW